MVRSGVACSVGHFHSCSVDGHALSHDKVTEIGVCHILSGESYFFSHHRHIVGSSLETGGIFKFGFAVVGGFHTAKSGGNHVAALVSLTGTAVNEHVSGFVFHK